VNIIKELFLDSKQRLFITGDLHGSLDLLESSLKELGFISGQDVLICVGDLVDRHPKSEETLIKFLFDKTGSFYSVRGNHDQMMVDNDWDLQLYNGGKWIIAIILEELHLFSKQILPNNCIIIFVVADFMIHKNRNTRWMYHLNFFCRRY
jgi:predicted phosphodiesterase